MAHKAGFVSIVGKPNAGKSTLMNALVGEKMAIITPKAQTTRHRILGIYNEDDLQIVFSDTPGVIKPRYGLQESMMSAVDGSLEDADLILFVTDINERQDETDVLDKLKHTKSPIAVIVNKVDTSRQEYIVKKINYWQELLKPQVIIPVSALEKFNVEAVMNFVVDNLPEHPPYYDKEELSDKSVRFFVSEIIREKIFMFYSEEIPYSTEVIITSYKEEAKIIHIQAEIIVERESQKNILIGKGGASLKRVGTKARTDIEAFVGKQVFLQTFVKVVEDWRNNPNYLKGFGYDR